MSQFYNFDIIIRRISGDPSGKLLTIVADAPVAKWRYNFEWFPDGWRDRLNLAGVNVKSSRDGRELRGELTKGVPLAATMASVGHAFFDLLFPQESQIYNLFGMTCALATRDKRAVCVRLDFGETELAGLPWEAIRWPLYGTLAPEICQAEIYLVRHLGDALGLPGFDHPPSEAPTIMIVAADPLDANGSRDQLVSVSLDVERHQCEGLIKAFSGLECVTVAGPDTLEGIRRSTESVLKRGRRLIGFHFIGHGSIDDFGGYLVGEDADRRAHPVYWDDLKSALKPITTLQWALLNACWLGHQPLGCSLSGLATSLAALKGVPTVIAYARPVATEAARALSEEFYQKVLKGAEPLESAITTFQERFQNPGSLVLIERTVLGARFETFGRVSTGAECATTASEELNRQPMEHNAPGKGRVGENESVNVTSAPESRVHVAPIPAATQMIHVPAGPYRKGFTEKQLQHILSDVRRGDLSLDLKSLEDALREEQSEEVFVPDFLIAKTLVTNREYAAFAAATGYKTGAERLGDRNTWRQFQNPAELDHPVVNVSFEDAQRYCEWVGKRLPTVDEWKKAFRGPKSLIYPWGDSFDTLNCNTAESCPGRETTPVDMFPQGASAYGCLDLVGNVEEWLDTNGLSDTKLVMGGSWCMTCQIYGLPVLHRLARTDFNSNDLGFRCAADPR